MGRTPGVEDSTADLHYAPVVVPTSSLFSDFILTIVCADFVGNLMLNRQAVKLNTLTGHLRSAG